jgi:hypothetical protein
MLWQDPIGGWSGRWISTGIYEITFPQPFGVAINERIMWARPFVTGTTYRSQRYNCQIYDVTGNTARISWRNGSSALSGDFTFECYMLDIGSVITSGLLQWGKFPETNVDTPDMVDGEMWTFQNGIMVPGPTEVGGGGVQMTAVFNSCARPRYKGGVIYGNSVCFWFKRDPAQETMYMCSGAAYPNTGSSGYSGHAFRIEPDRFRVEYLSGSSSETTSTRRTVAYDAVPNYLDNQWHHFCATAQAITATPSHHKLYIDGQPVGVAPTFTGNGTSVNWRNTSDCTFQMNSQKGAAPSLTPWGALADYRMYNRVLSQAEVQQIYQGNG